MEIAFPFAVNVDGRVADATYEDHVRQLIEQLLFTEPGERVNRPDFGCGLMELVFAPAGSEMAAATQALVQSSLQRWLSDVIRVEGVHVDNEESKLIITIQYVLLSTQERSTATYVRSV